MNERIKELALEARIAYYSKNGSYEGSDDGLSVIPSTQSLEKFAELIVQECINVSEAHAKSLESQPCDPEFEQYEDGIVSGIYEATATIKEHFGVPE